MALLGCFLVPVIDAPAAGLAAGGPSGASRRNNGSGQQAGTRFWPSGTRYRGAASATVA